MRAAARAVTVGLVAAGVAALAPAGTATADPQGEAIHLVCGGTHYAITTAPGNGPWTPGLVTSSTTVLVPVAFGESQFTLRDAAGVTVASETEPATAKGSAGKQAGALTCTYSFSDTFTVTAEEAAAEGLPGAGTYTASGSGSVLVRVTGR